MVWQSLTLVAVVCPVRQLLPNVSCLAALYGTLPDFQSSLSKLLQSELDRSQHSTPPSDLLQTHCNDAPLNQDIANSCVALRYGRRFCIAGLSDSLNTRQDAFEAQHGKCLGLSISILQIPSLIVPLDTTAKVQVYQLMHMYYHRADQTILVPHSRPRFALSRTLNDNERCRPAGAS